MSSSNHSPDDATRPAWHAAVCETAGRPDLADRLTRPASDLLLRFGETYARLAILPRAQRRRLQRRLGVGLAGAALLLALGLASQTALAGTITVDGTTCTLANAITTANSGTDTNGCVGGSAGADTIDLTVNFTMAALGRLPQIASDITLEGNSHTIDGNGLYRLFDVAASGTLTLKNATVTNGLDPQGAGIRNNGALHVLNSTISDNLAVGGSGGGILNYGDMTVVNSTISGNTATGDNRAGGGIGIGGEGTTEIQNSTITDNGVAGAYSQGGGIALFSSATVTIQNSTISGNSASHSGDYGGYGGGIGINMGTLVVQNSTITGNSVDNGNGYGGGIYRTYGDVTVMNSIVALQSAGTDCVPGSPITTGGYNIESADTCGFTGTGDQQNRTSGDLKLGSLAANGGPTQTMALGSGSVAIDTIADTVNGCVAGTSTDQRGAVRAGGASRGGAACDIGAYEANSSQHPNAVALRGLTAAGGSAGDWLAALGAGLAAVLGGLAVRRGGLEREATKGRERHEARRSRREPAGAGYGPPAVVYEAPLEARAGSPLSLPLEELIE